jgi:hypothetical protein
MTGDSRSLQAYAIPCMWQMYGVMHLTAHSLEEAIKQAREDRPLPDGEYMTDSFEVDLEALNIYNDQDKLILEEIRKYFG